MSAVAVAVASLTLATVVSSGDSHLSELRLSRNLVASQKPRVVCLYYATIVRVRVLLGVATVIGGG